MIGNLQHCDDMNTARHIPFYANTKWIVAVVTAVAWDFLSMVSVHLLEGHVVGILSFGPMTNYMEPLALWAWPSLGYLTP